MYIHIYIFMYIHTQTHILMMKWVSSEETDLVTRVQILDEVVFISHSANTLEKVYIQPSFLQIAGQTGNFSLCMAISVEEGKL